MSILELIDDNPIIDSKYLDHGVFVKNLIKFLEHKATSAPLSIGIQGVWGSGKTSIMRTLEKNIDKKKFDTLFFEGWKYEYSNPALSLVASIAEQYSDKSETIKNIVKATMNLFTKKYLDLDINELINSFRDNSVESQTLSQTIQDIIKKQLKKKKLLILIDDLDRCDIENALQLLALVKLFLDIDNCICIAAVDFQRLERAWYKKYGIDYMSKNEGRLYLEKIFQLQVNIPVPSVDEIEDYMKNLSDLDSSLRTILSKIIPPNPRAIKKILNLICYRSFIADASEEKEALIAAIGWTMLETLLSVDIMKQFYNVLNDSNNFYETIKQDPTTWKSKITPEINKEIPKHVRLDNEDPTWKEIMKIMNYGEPNSEKMKKYLEKLNKENSRM